MQRNLKTGIIVLIATLLSILIWNQYDQVGTPGVQAIAQPSPVITPTKPGNQDKQIEALRLAAQSTQILDDTYEGLVRSVLLATESIGRYPTIEGNIALRRGLGFLLQPVIQLDHPHGVSAVAFSPDGSLLATGSQDGAIRVWEIAVGQEIAQMKHDDQIAAIAFSPDGHWLATGSRDSTARIWEVSTEQEILQVAHKQGVDSVTFAPDGKRLITGSFDKTTRIWDIATGQEVMNIPQYGGTVAVSPDGQWLVTGGGDNTVSIFDISTGHELDKITLLGQVSNIAFSPDGKWLITAGWDRVQVWDTASRAVNMIIKETEPIEALAVNPNGRWLATGGQEGMIRVWDITTGQEIARAVHPSYGMSLAFSGDGRRLASGNWNNTARIWQIELWPELLIKNDDVPVKQVIFSPDSRWLATKHEDHTARLWDVSLGQEVARLQHQDRINDLTFSGDSRWLATAGADSTVQVLNTTVLNTPFKLAHDGPVNRVIFSEDGQRLATSSNDGTARLWDMVTGRETLRVSHGTFINQEGKEEPWWVTIALSPDSQKLATGSNDSTARIWDTATGDELARFYHEPVVELTNLMGVVTRTITYTWSVNHVSFSSNGKWFMADSSYGYTTGSFEQTRIWEVATQREILGAAAAEFSPDSQKVALYDYNSLSLSQLSANPKVIWTLGLGGRQSITFSPDGQLLGLGHWNPRYNEGNAVIVDTATGQSTVFLPHDGQVWLVQFSPDNQWAATLSSGAIGPYYEGGGVRVWDTAVGREVIYLAEGGKMAFSPNGRWLAAGSNKGGIHLLYLSPEDLTTEACARLPRNLTRQEWQQYLGGEPYRATCPNLPVPEN